MSKYAILDEAATAASKRLGRPANLFAIAMNMRDHGFEFTHKICINDLYVHPSRLKRLTKVARDLYQAI